MATSSSTKRAAKMAQRGKGRKVRFQNGTTFPAIIALILILGTGLIIYSRQSALTPADATPPQPPASWEMAYGLNLCGKWYQFDQSAAIEGTPAYDKYKKYGLDSQADGLIYLNVTDENKDAIAGKRAVLQKFFDVYGANVGDDTITFSPDYLPRLVGADPAAVPTDSGTGTAADTAAATASETATAAATDTATATGTAGDTADPNAALAEYSEADTKCNGKKAEMAVRVWNSPTATESQRYIAKVGKIQFAQPAMVIAVYFDDPDAEQTQPPSIDTLKAHIAAAAPAPAPSVPAIVPGTSVPGAVNPTGTTTPAVTQPVTSDGSSNSSSATN